MILTEVGDFIHHEGHADHQEAIGQICLFLRGVNSCWFSAAGGLIVEISSTKE
jgi:hypothetical protein